MFVCCCLRVMGSLVFAFVRVWVCRFLVFWAGVGSRVSV